MALVGQKGTYAQVQAPKDYLGNALSNIERNNFLYREEKRRQDELEQAQKAAAQKEQSEREEKAFKEKRELSKPLDFGVSKITLTTNKAINEMADEVYEINSKKKKDSIDNARLSKLYNNIDLLKLTAENYKSVSADAHKLQQEDGINNIVQDSKGDIVESILNIKAGGELLYDKETGKMQNKLVDTQGNVTYEDIDMTADKSYLMSKLVRKSNVDGKGGLIDSLREDLKVQEGATDTGTKRKINENQVLSADERLSSMFATPDENRIKDLLQQANVDFHWKDEEDKQAKIKEAKRIYLDRALSGLNLADDQKTNVGLLNYYETKKQHAITNARENAKTSGSTTQQSPLSTTVPKTGVNAYNIKVAKGDTQSAVIKAKGKGSLIDTVVFQPRANGKSDFVLGGYQTPKASMLTPKGKEVLANEGAEALDDSHYLDAGKDRFRKISYKQTPELFLAELRKLESLEGGNYTSMEQFKKEMFPNAMPKATQSAPKAKAIQFDKYGNIIM